MNEEEISKENDKPTYELTDTSKVIDGHTVYRIKAIRDFRFYTSIDRVKIPIVVSKGELGGWVSSEHNLSQNPNCWIRGNAVVMNSAIVRPNYTYYGSYGILINGNAVIRDQARIIGSEIYITGNAIIRDRALVYSETNIFDNVLIEGNASIGDVFMAGDIYTHIILKGNVIIRNNARIHGVATLDENVIIENNAFICSPGGIPDRSLRLNRYEAITKVDGTYISGHCRIKDDARIMCGCFVEGFSGVIGGNAVISHSEVRFDFRIDGNARVLGSDIKDGTITDNAIIYKSNIEDCTVRGDSYIYKRLIDSHKTREMIIDEPSRICEEETKELQESNYIKEKELEKKHNGYITTSYLKRKGIKVPEFKSETKK